MSRFLKNISASLGRTSPTPGRKDSSESISTPRPDSPEVTETIDFLLETVVIPPAHVDGITIELRKILQEPGHRPYDQIISRASHPCVKEYLADVFQLLTIQQQQVPAASAQFKGKDQEDFLENAELQKVAYYTSIAQLLGRGFDVALKPNLVFDAAGNPIGLRDKDKTRFPRCNAVLSGMGGKRKKRQTKKKSMKKRKTLRRVRH